MQSTDYIWQNGHMVPWQDAKIHVLTHSLHYGSAVFEGIRFYNTAEGPAIFKLDAHVRRLFYSAKHLAMRIPYSEKKLSTAIIETVRVNKIEEGYIRPLVYFGYGSMKLIPDNNLPVDTIIACWPWGKYIEAQAIDVKTSDYIRIHPLSTVPDAKISGHYVNSILAGLAIKNTHYQEALLLDSEGYVAEGSAENVFIVKDGILITPPTGTILVGITRNAVLEIADYYGIPVQQSKFTRYEMLQADEAFFCGTAVEILPIRSLDDRLIAEGKVGPITERIKTTYQKVVHGQLSHFYHDLTWVNQAEKQ